MEPPKHASEGGNPGSSLKSAAGQWLADIGRWLPDVWQWTPDFRQGLPEAWHWLADARQERTDVCERLTDLWQRPPDVRERWPDIRRRLAGIWRPLANVGRELPDRSPFLTGTDLDDVQFGKHFNAFGAEGWELVSVTGLKMQDGRTNYMVAVMKRPKG